MCNRSLLKIFLQFLVIVLPLQSGLAIECFICDSTRDAVCENLTPSGKLIAEKCEPNKMVRNGSWLMELSKITYFNDGRNLEVGMLCQKIIAMNETGQRVTVRSCQIDGLETDPCTLPQDRIRNRQITIEHCSVCNRDKCNGSSQTLLTWQFKVLFGFGMLAFSRLWR